MNKELEEFIEAALRREREAREAAEQANRELNRELRQALEDLRDPCIDTVAAVVHLAYLDACRRLGWSVKPENRGNYESLSEESKELYRATARAVLDYVRRTFWDQDTLDRAKDAGEDDG